MAPFNTCRDVCARVKSDRLRSLKGRSSFVNVLVVHCLGRDELHYNGIELTILIIARVVFLCGFFNGFSLFFDEGLAA